MVGGGSLDRVGVLPACIASITPLQATLDEFQTFYNEIRPHRAIGRKTPAFAYELIPKASPNPLDTADTWQVRYDIVDSSGSITLRYAGKLRHLGIGRAHARTEIICLFHGREATAITYTGDVLAEFIINPEKDYQAKTAEPPSSRVQLSTMS